MDWMDRLSLFSPFDYGAVAILMLAWLGIGWRVEHSSANHPSVSSLMANYRYDWMEQMVTREPRILDSQFMANLRQGTTFFASASMIAIGGGLALIGNAERLVGLANDLTLESHPAIVWEIKLLVMLLFAANAFLKFVWSHRLFGYCSVLIASVPNDPQDPRAYPRAKQAAEINITAARSFNRGMRTIYFGLASAAWLAGPLALLFATSFTLLVIWRREFASQSRSILLNTQE